REALRCEGRSLTYRQLDRAAARLARTLRSLGVGLDTPVGVCAERSLEMVVALWAVLKAGGAYLPLDPDYPADRLAFMLADSAVPVVLAQEHLVPHLPSLDGGLPSLDGGESAPRLVSLEGVAEPPAEQDEETFPAPGEGGEPESLAYIIYTSGSTGRPKGAMNRHRAIVNRLLWMQAEYGLGPDDVVLQ